MLTLDNVYRASYALKNVVRKTDVIYAPKLCPDAQIYLKTENLQITGSFLEDDSLMLDIFTPHREDFLR